MLSFLCIFFDCKWRHIFNVDIPSNFIGPFGIYQCKRCKTISKGKYNAS